MRKTISVLITVILISSFMFGCSSKDTSVPATKTDASEVKNADSTVVKGVEDSITKETENTAAKKDEIPVKGVQTKPAPSPVQGITTNKIKFTVLNGDEIPQDIISFSEKHCQNAGFKAFEDKDGQYIVLICLGQRNTGGYSISVKSVEDIEGKTSIIVQETKPAPDAIVTQIITYPSVYIRIANIAPNFVIQNTEGVIFPEYKD